MPSKKRKLTAFFRPLVDLVLPPQCAGCEVGLDGEPELMWCDDCLKKLCSDPTRCCPACGAERTPPKFAGGRCGLCRDLKLHFDRAICVGNYHSLMQKLIVKLKGQYDESLALQFGMLLSRQIGANRLEIRCDLIVPAPIHWWSRLRRPSYIAGTIAEGVARTYGAPVVLDVLKCSRKAKKQATLSTTNRFENVKGAFKVAQPRKIAGKSVLLVDDVVTSGATANQLAKVLKEAGARSVIVAAIARGVRQS